MTTRTVLLTIAAVASLGLTVMAQGVLSGHASFESRFDLTNPALVDSLALDLGVTYSTNEMHYSSDTVIALPGTWIWQEFSGGGTLGAYSVEANVLFSGYLVEHLYTEAIVGLSFGGVDIAFHAAQLGKAVLGGPHDGCALRIEGSRGGIGIVSTTELGARIEDDDFDGITIAHGFTGQTRHYATDPRSSETDFFGEKISLTGFSDHSAEIDITGYLTSAKGLEYLSIEATGIVIQELLGVEVEAELTFSVAEKTFTITPKLGIQESFCLTLYSMLITADPTGFHPEGFKFLGFDFSTKIGPVTIRDVTLFDLCEVALTMEAYGSQFMLIDDILDDGYEYYPDYWEMLSIAYAGPGCCEGESNLLMNFYFERDGENLFDLAMIFAEANIPLGSILTVSLGTQATLPDLNWIRFAFEVAF